MSPGSYKLPMNEGSVNVYQIPGQECATVEMFTSSSTIRYYHDLVRVNRPEYRIDYGWYAHIQHDCDSRDLFIEGVKLPVYDREVENSSVQQKYFSQMFEEM